VSVYRPNGVIVLCSGAKNTTQQTLMPIRCVIFNSCLPSFPLWLFTYLDLYVLWKPE